MTHGTTLRQQKLDIAARIKAAIVGLKRQFVSRDTLTFLDRLLGLVLPGKAYAEGMMPFIPDMHRNFPHTESKRLILLHDLGLLLKAYWELIRTDESRFLSLRLETIEDYVTYGVEQCDILGDMEVGFYLFNKKAQQLEEDTEDKEEGQ